MGDIHYVGEGNIRAGEEFKERKKQPPHLTMAQTRSRVRGGVMSGHQVS